MPTAHLDIDTVQASQNQKEVTINNALHRIDAILNTGIIDKDLATPPVSPAEGDVYIVPDTGTGEWTGHTNKIAYYYGGWNFITPLDGMTVWINDDGRRYIFLDGSWQVNGIINKPDGEYFRFSNLEVDETNLTGSPHSTTVTIPNRATVLYVNVRVTEAITGVSSFNVGVPGDASKFGSGIGVGLDSTNIGVVTPTPYYSDTTLLLTPTTGAFTAGSVNIVMHYTESRGSWNW